jgi:uncharacterized membrane protein
VQILVELILWANNHSICNIFSDWKTSAAVVTLLFASGVWCFRKTERSVAEVIWGLHDK